MSGEERIDESGMRVVCVKERTLLFTHTTKHSEEQMQREAVLLFPLR